MIAHISVIASLLAGLACWRVSRPAALALFAAFAASVAYALAPWEPLRWVSALVGLVGVWEMMSGTAEAASPPARGYRDFDDYRRESTFAKRVGRLPKRTWIGLLMIASMAGDVAALLAWRAWQEWAMPASQIVVCLAIALIARWPEGRTS